MLKIPDSRIPTMWTHGKRPLIQEIPLSAKRYSAAGGMPGQIDQKPASLKVLLWQWDQATLEQHILHVHDEVPQANATARATLLPRVAELRRRSPWLSASPTL